MLINWNDDSRITLDIRQDERPDWEKLKQNPLLSQVRLVGINQPPSNQMLFQLALAIKSHPQITKIIFWSCEIKDLGPLCLALTQKHQLASLHFEYCGLTTPCVAETLRFLLEENLVESLAVENCKVGNDFEPIISKGLCRNLSLRTFRLVHQLVPNRCVRESLREMLANNRNLVELGFSFKIYRHSDFFHPREQMRALTTLSVCFSPINLHSMESLILTCCLSKSLNVLELCGCTFEENSLELLVLTLSSNHVIKTLIFSTPCKPQDEIQVTVPIDLGTLQVDKLVLREAIFTSEIFSQMIESIANNNFIKCLDIRFDIFEDDDVNDKRQAFGEVCEVLLRQNRGPSELAIEVFDADTTAMIISAMAENTSIKSLTVDQMDADDLERFAEGVANMNCLRKLGFLSQCVHTATFFKKLKESLEHNTALWSLSFEDIDADNVFVSPYLPEIHYLLAINRVGRHEALTARIPLGLWARLLAMTSDAPDGLYFVLKERPDIVVPTRKRKDRDDN